MRSDDEKLMGERIGNRSLTNVLEIMKELQRINNVDCEHDELHFRLSDGNRCYKCMLRRLVHQRPSVNAFVDIIYMENALQHDEKLQKLVCSCHLTDIPDSFHLAQVMWDTLTCSSARNSRARCTPQVAIAAKLLSQLIKFLTYPNCDRMINYMVKHIAAVPISFTEKITLAITELISVKPELSAEIQYEALLLNESMPGSFGVFLLTSQIVTYSHSIPLENLHRYAEKCVSILLATSESHLERRLLAGLGIEFLSNRYPNVLEGLQGELVNSLFQRLHSFELPIVRNLSCAFTSSQIAAEFWEAICFDKILADCLLTCHNGLIVETVLDSLMGNGLKFLDFMCANINAILRSLFVLLDTQSSDHDLVQKTFTLLTTIFAHPRTCQINELLKVKMLGHCVQTYGGHMSTQLAASKCFISFLIGGHLPKKTDIAIANTLLRNCFQGSQKRLFSLEELSRAMLLFAEAVQVEACCQNSPEKLTLFSSTVLEEFVPSIAERIENGQEHEDQRVTLQISKISLIVFNHLKFEGLTKLPGVLRSLWPLLKSWKDDPGALKLVARYVFLVGEHETEEEFRVILVGLRKLKHHSSSPEAVYSSLFLCHLDSQEKIDVQEVMGQLGLISSACRIWSPRLRRNLFDNLFRFICPHLTKLGQEEIQKLFLKFQAGPINTRYLPQFPHLLDSLMTSSVLRFHARKILICACNDENIEVIRYVLESRSSWKDFLINHILMSYHDAKRNDLFQKLLATNPDLRTAILGSLLSIIQTFIDHQSKNRFRAFELLLTLLKTSSFGIDPFESIEVDVESLLSQICARSDENDELPMTLAVLTAIVNSRHEQHRQRLVEKIAHETAFLSRVVSRQLADSLGLLLLVAQASPPETIFVPLQELKALTLNSGLESNTRRAALLVLSHTIDAKSHSISLDEKPTTDELLSITDHLLLHPLFEHEALELWCAIQTVSSSSDPGLLTILRERLRMGTIAENVYSSNVTMKLLRCFRRGVRYRGSLRPLIPFLKIWRENLTTRT